MKRSLFLLISFVFLSSCSTYIKQHHSKEKGKTIIAHRGASGYLPEHTLEGVAMAHSWGVDFIELDVVITKDDKAVILHDIHIDSTTNISQVYPRRKRKDGRYYAVDFTLAEIKKLKVHERMRIKNGKQTEKYFSNRFPLHQSSFEVPTLEEFIELVQGLNKTTEQNVGIYVELKKPSFHTQEGKDIAKIVMKILKEYGYENENSKAILQCFDPKTLIRLKTEFETKIPLVQLIANPSWGEPGVDYKKMQTFEGLKEISKYAIGIGPWFGHILSKTEKGFKVSELVTLAHRYGLKVHTYTHRSDRLPKFVQDEDEFFEILFKELKVDGIFSDFADRAMIYKFL
ncbi:MAG: glycerophosphodiester phosphodiesterase [Bacteriovoracaceae bacterium]